MHYSNNVILVFFQSRQHDYLIKIPISNTIVKYYYRCLSSRGLVLIITQFQLFAQKGDYVPLVLLILASIACCENIGDK